MVDVFSKIKEKSTTKSTITDFNIAIKKFSSIYVKNSSIIP